MENTLKEVRIKKDGQEVTLSLKEFNWIKDEVSKSKDHAFESFDFLKGGLAIPKGMEKIK